MILSATEQLGFWYLIWNIFLVSAPFAFKPHIAAPERNVLDFR